MDRLERLLKRFLVVCAITAGLFLTAFSLLRASGLV